MPAKLLIADQRPIVRAGLRDSLVRPKINVVAEAANDEEAIRLARKHKPDVLLLGRFVEQTIPAALKRVRAKLPNLPVIVFGPDTNLTYVARSIALGAKGFLSESCQREDLCAAIRDVAAGKDAWTEGQKKRLTGGAVAPKSLDVHVTRREIEVIRQIAFGLPNLEIALLLGISIETVKEHVQNIFRKLKVSDRTKVAVWAIRHGLD